MKVSKVQSASCVYVLRLVFRNMKEIYFISLFFGLLVGDLIEAQETPYEVFERDSYKEADWEYEGLKGPNYWREDYPECGGLFQSPIALPNRREADRHQYVPKGLNNYNVPHQMDVVFNGPLVQMQINEDDDETIPDSVYINVTQRYSLYKIIFHWGQNDGEGGEHSISGFNFPFELQYLFYDRKHHSPAEAAKQPGGILQNVVLLKVVPNSQTNELNTKVINVLSAVNGTTDKVVCRWVPIFPFWKEFQQKDYYTYKGSLTFPPCTPTKVNVFVSDFVLTVDQMAVLRSLVSPTGTRTDINVRPSQPYNKRKITYVSRETRVNHPMRTNQERPGNLNGRPKPFSSYPTSRPLSIYLSSRPRDSWRRSGGIRDLPSYLNQGRDWYRDYGMINSPKVHVARSDWERRVGFEDHYGDRSSLKDYHRYGPRMIFDTRNAYGDRDRTDEHGQSSSFSARADPSWNYRDQGLAMMGRDILGSKEERLDILAW